MDPVSSSCSPKTVKIRVLGVTFGGLRVSLVGTVGKATCFMAMFRVRSIDGHRYGE